jgi:hypothetical protein
LATDIAGVEEYGVLDTPIINLASKTDKVAIKDLKPCFKLRSVIIVVDLGCVANDLTKDLDAC